MKNKLTFIILNIAIILLGLYLAFFNTIYKYDNETIAHKIDENESYNMDEGTVYRPIFYYEVNGKEYTCESKLSSSSYPKKSHVYYNSKNPALCLTDYDKSSSNFFGVGLIIMATFFLILCAIIPSINDDSDYDTRKKAEEIINKVVPIMYKGYMTIRRVILGIVILILFLVLIVDVIVIKQTIKARNYIDTTATYIESRPDEEDSDYIDYVYVFESINKERYEVIENESKDTPPEKSIKIKYDEKNPKEYYVEGATFNTSDFVWFIIKLIIEIILIIIFFNHELLEKINLSLNVSAK